MTRADPLGLRDLADHQAVRDVVADGHVREQRVVLEDRVHVAIERRDRRDVRAVEQDPAGGRQSRSPAIIRRVVVLPEPDGPSIEKNSPSRTSRSMPSTATTSPKRFSTASRRTATGDAAADARVGGSWSGSPSGTSKAASAGGPGPRSAALGCAALCRAPRSVSRVSGRRPVRCVIDFAPCSPCSRLGPARASPPPSPWLAVGRRRLRRRAAVADPADRARRRPRRRARSTSSPRTTRSCRTRSTSSPGETVLLHVINGGLEVHEAVIGDAAVQDAWEVAEAATVGRPPGPTPVVSVPPDVAGLRIVVALRAAGRRRLDGAGRRARQRDRRGSSAATSPGTGHAGCRSPSAGSCRRPAPPR